MFQKIKEKKQQLVRFLFGSFTATALMFTFQACYGMPPQNELDATIQGVVKSAETGEPIQGITIFGASDDLFVQTGVNGTFQLPVHFGNSQYLIHVKDEDGAENGSYQDLDTMLDASVLTDGVTILLQSRSDNQ